MRVGDVVAERFELKSLAGEGGMGSVWRALDRASNAAVALKVMRGAQDAERFEREAALLAELAHPAIVRYLAHGRAGDELWVAMEWLEGEDLHARLARGPLGLGASVTLARRLAEALAAVHARGVVHRDVKPANVLLPSGRIVDAKLLDFGIARSVMSPSLTRTGVPIGTPGYMAPEQARGERDVSPAADVFSLGCVLYECIAGVPAFAGAHFVAILAKVLVQDAPRLSGVPVEVSSFVARLLSKDPAARPADGAAALAEIAALEALTRGEDETMVPGPARRPTAPPSLSGSESRLASVVLVRGTIDLDSLRAAASAFGARAEILANGTVLAVLAQPGPAKDQAAAAARLTLVLAAMTGARCALATGRAALGERLPVGEAIDRASSMLARGDGVRIDDVTRGLLDARFDVDGDVLRGERPMEGSLRTVLGKPVPFVGRASELAALEGLFGACVEEESGHAAIVTAPAGAGKSRLLHELIEKLRAARPGLEVWIGRADSMSAGSSFGILGDALRRTLGVHAGEDVESGRDKIREAARRLGLEPRVAWFLGELVGVPFDEAESEQLAIARRNAQAMGDQMRRAFEDFTLAACKREPLVLALEDMHWGDVSSVSFVDSTLRLASERPLFVVATARPDTSLVRDLWSERAATRIPLGELGRRAAEKLVGALCPAASAERVALLVERAGGNALFLEELVRAELEGHGAQAPGSVVAMLQSRLEALAPELRLLLRAASVFGRTFWRGAVRGLTGVPETLLDALLDTLAERELVASVAGGRFPDEREYVFRHELMREAAYAMLTDDDRVLAHRHAAEWLEGVGETDAAAIAEHFEKGAERTRATPFWLRAAKDALDGNDLGAALGRAERGIGCGAEGELLGALLFVEAEAYAWRGDSSELAAELASEAATLVGEAQWGDVASLSAALAAQLGRREELVAWADKLSAAIERSDASPSVHAAAARVSFSLIHEGKRERGEALLARIPPASGAVAAAWVAAARAHCALLDGDPTAYVEGLERAHDLLERAGLVRPALSHRVNHAFGLIELGRHADAAATLRAVAAESERMGLHHISATALHNLGWALARSGDLEDARRVEEDAARAFEQDTRMEGASRIYLARIALACGDASRAESEARAALALIESLPPLRAHALGALAAALRARGDLDGAASAAKEAISTLEAHGAEDGEAFVRLTHAELLADLGDHAGARAALRHARDQLLERARKIRSPSTRDDFLTHVPEHARTLALLREWTGEA